MSSNKISIVMLFAIGLVPVVIAYIVFIYYPHLLPTATTNNGELIQPSVSMESIGINESDHKWALLIPITGTCDSVCEKRFYFAHQVNIALQKESERVKRIMVISTGTNIGQSHNLEKRYPEMHVAKVDHLKVEAAFKDQNIDFFSDKTIFLVDPNGNIMMYYTNELIGQPMLKDIKFLLKISNIG